MTGDFSAIFDELRRIMLSAAPSLVVTTDTAGTLVLHTSWAERGKKAPFFFGQVSIKKSYVAYHLMPLYVLPRLESLVTDRLAARRQGKSCFNVKQADETVYADLRRLTEACDAAEAELRRTLVT